MTVKPTKMTLPHDSWRGTSADLVELAGAVRDEIGRATSAVLKMMEEQSKEDLKRQRATYEQTLRSGAGLSSTAQLTPPLLAQLAKADADATASTANQVENNKKFISERGVKVTFGYSGRGGQFRSSADPEFLRNVSNADGITMRGNVFALLTASILVTMQNRPWEIVSLDVEGDDPDWVGSAAMHLNSMLSERESRGVRFLRNTTFRGLISVLAWIWFTPTIGRLLQKFSMEPLMAVPTAVLPAVLVGFLYQRLTPPFLITGVKPSLLLEIVKAAVSPVLGAIAGVLANRFIGGKP
jgi:hypothetical protein